MRLRALSVCSAGGAEMDGSRQDAEQWPSVFWHGSSGRAGVRPNQQPERS
jgi:hypothetical protein